MLIIVSRRRIEKGHLMVLAEQPLASEMMRCDSHFGSEARLAVLEWRWKDVSIHRSISRSQSAVWIETNTPFPVPFSLAFETKAIQLSWRNMK